MLEKLVLTTLPPKKIMNRLVKEQLFINVEQKRNCDIIKTKITHREGWK